MPKITPAGRPKLEFILDRLTETNAVLHKELGGLPGSVEASSIWRDIWLEETHHSTALEGNTLTPRELFDLVEHGVASGSRELVYYLEVQGYARAAAWVYEQAVEESREDAPWRVFTLAHVRQIHAELVRPVWTLYPPAGAGQPGEWAKVQRIIAGAPVKPPPPVLIDSLMDQWLGQVQSGPAEGEHPTQWAARLHADFEAIHPFPDGNGRAGRLAMNYLLILCGYPPAIILKSQRSRYIRALARAQVEKDYQALAEMVARAVLENLNRLLLPVLAGSQTLLPLGTLAKGTPYSPDYLRQLVSRGKLKATKQGGEWFSTREELERYITNRTQRGRRTEYHEKKDTEPVSGWRSSQGNRGDGASAP